MSGRIVERRLQRIGRENKVTTVAADNEVPVLGHVTSIADFDLETVADLYHQHGLPETRGQQCSVRSELGIPLDGRAGERAGELSTPYLPDVSTATFWTRMISVRSTAL